MPSFFGEKNSKWNNLENKDEILNLHIKNIKIENKCEKNIPIHNF